MVNHKWKDESISKYHKTERCVKCGVYRDWIGGDMQCWQYWWPKTSDVGMVKTQFKRPECVGRL